MSDLKQAQIAKSHLSELYLLKSGTTSWAARSSHRVVAVGAGYRVLDGKRTDEPCVRVYVEPNAAAAPRKTIPDWAEGIRVDIVASTDFRPLGSPNGARLRPARPGCSVGYRDGHSQMAGTLGAIVEKQNRWFILSNNHVLADENRLAPGTSVVQPGCLDDPQAGEIARLSEFVELKAGEANHHDCAIAEVVDRSWVDPRFLSPIEQLPSASTVFPIEGAPVEKIGRTTTHTKGEVFDIDFDVEVHYARLGRLVFQGQFAIQATGTTFAQAGDSGALVVHGVSRRPVGLLFAGSAQFTVVSPLSPVLETLGVHLVT